MNVLPYMWRFIVGKYWTFWSTYHFINPIFHIIWLVQDLADLIHHNSSPLIFISYLIFFFFCLLWKIKFWNNYIYYYVLTLDFYFKIFHLIHDSHIFLLCICKKKKKKKIKWWVIYLTLYNPKDFFRKINIFYKILGNKSNVGGFTFPKNLVWFLIKTHVYIPRHHISIDYI